MYASTPYRWSMALRSHGGLQLGAGTNDNGMVQYGSTCAQLGMRRLHLHAQHWPAGEIQPHPQHDVAYDRAARLRIGFA